jgi:uncharacterized repeat protein (TIGR03803 family)
VKSKRPLRSGLTFVRFFKTLILSAFISIVAATDSSAQIFKTIYNFSVSGNSDGSQPYETGVLLAGSKLYGTTYYGGDNGNGVVFSVNTNGSAFTMLHSFSAAPFPGYTNTDGEAPQGSLTLVGDTLFGATLNGGLVSGGYGTIYSIKTNGTVFTLLHSFDSTNGRNGNGPLIIAGGAIFGTTESGGSGGSGTGTVFSMNLNGSGYKVLHAFTGPDGTFPNGVVLAGDTLYGTAFDGGANGRGAVFSVQTNGNNFTVLYSFSAGNAGSAHQFNDDGMEPQMLPAISGNTIYGTTTLGGYYGSGTLFSLNTNGSNFTVLRTFADNVNERVLLDGGGSGPMAVTVTNGVLYGVTDSGGDNNSGVLYAINTNGTQFNVLHTFALADGSTGYTNIDGQYPEGQLVLSGNSLFGTAEQGGQGNGTLFSVFVQPAITDIHVTGSNVAISGFNGIAGENCITLFTSNLALPVTNWTSIATNTLTAGNFTITATNAALPPRSNAFFLLKPR